MKKSVLYALPLCSAGLLTLAFPPYKESFLAWIALTPLFLALRRQGILFSGGLAWVFGLFFSVGTLNWHLRAAGFSDFLLFLAFFDLYFFLFGVLYSTLSQAIGNWIIIGAPAAWVSIEYLRSNLFFLAWPMNLLGHSQYQFLPVIQIADLTGVYGISFVLIMVNQFISELVEFYVPKVIPIPPRTTDSPFAKAILIHLTAVGGLVALVFMYGLEGINKAEDHQNITLIQPSSINTENGNEIIHYSTYTGGGKTRGQPLQRIRVALVQANVVARENMTYKEQIEHLVAYQDLTRQAAIWQPDLIVWPSSSIPAPIAGSRLVRVNIEEAAQHAKAFLLVGGAGYEKMKTNRQRSVPYANSEFLISPTGAVTAQYNKMQLLPFNEYLPLEGKITWPEWLTTVKESFLPGMSYTLFQVGDARFGTPICWENLLSDFFRQFVKRGANLMVSVANEGFLGQTAGSHQLLAMNVFRAVENRVAVIRSTTTGVSAFINSDGKIVKKVQKDNGKDLEVAGFLVGDFPLNDNKTFYTLHGDVFAFFSIALVLFAIAIGTRRRMVGSH